MNYEITGEAPRPDREVLCEFVYHPPLVNFRCERGERAYLATASVDTAHGPLELSALIPLELVARWRSMRPASTAGLVGEELAAECCGAALGAQLAKIVADGALARRLGLVYQAARVPMRTIRAYQTARRILEASRRTKQGRAELERMRARARTGDMACERICRMVDCLEPHVVTP